LPNFSPELERSDNSGYTGHTPRSNPVRVNTAQGELKLFPFLTDKILRAEMHAYLQRYFAIRED